MTNATKQMLDELSSVEFLTTEQASLLAKKAFKDYTKRSKQAKIVEKLVFDMVLACGSPNAVYNAVLELSKDNNVGVIKMNNYLVNIEFKNGYRCMSEFIAHNEDEAITKARTFVEDSTKSVWWWYVDRENPTITAELI